MAKLQASKDKKNEKKGGASKNEEAKGGDAAPKDKKPKQ